MTDPLAPTAPAVAIVDAAPFGRTVARFDDAIDLAFTRWRGHPVADEVFHLASQLGDWSVLWHIIGGLRGVAHSELQDEAVRLSTVLGIESLLVNQIVKRVFLRRRPISELKVPVRVRRPVTSSFPSGHASSAFCAAVLLSAGHRRSAPLWYGLATVVAASRIHVKLHHASDVVAGALLGTVIGSAARSLWPLDRKR